MKSDKCVLVIGGNRANNFETFAPIVYDLKTNGYKIITLFQNKKIQNLIEQNKILNPLYEKKKILSKKNFSIISIIQLIYILSKYKKGIVLTNRFFNSIKFKILIKLLKLINFKTLYTKSFSRPPTKNIYSLVGAPPKVKTKSDLCDFCILPTNQHMIEYALVGYQYNQMIISGYPKMNTKWIEFCSKIINLEKISNTEILIVLGIYHDKFEEVLNDLFSSICNNFTDIKICLKPHPTNNLEIINKFIVKFTEKNLFFLSNQNVMSLSTKSKVIITHGTSSSVDASCVSDNVYCYWGEKKDKVEKYINKTFDDQKGFEILESNLLSKPFIKADLYTKNDLDEIFKNVNFSKIISNNKINNFSDMNITKKIEEKIFNNVV